MNARENLGLESEIESDLAALNRPVAALLAAGVKVHCLRDLTRGGLASALVEIAETSGREITISESAVPVREDVRGACEILGLDPMYVANEGRFLAVVPAQEGTRAFEALRSCPESRGAAVIGEVTQGSVGRVVVKSSIGVPRILEMLSGEQLPRIC